MNLPEIYSRIHELETIAGLPETADIFTGELEDIQREVMALNLSTPEAATIRTTEGAQDAAGGLCHGDEGYPWGEGKVYNLMIN